MKNSLWNILAVVVPTAVAIPSLGVLARILGIELFGVFTLIFALVGYASIFDMGLSRAVVRSIAKERNSLAEVKNTLYTASSVVVVLGSLAGLLLFLFSEQLPNLLSVSKQYQAEVAFCFRIMSIVIPVFILSLVWLSYLEGLERFKELSALRVVSSSLLALLPLIGVIIEPVISYAVIGLFLARIISFILVFVYSHRELSKFSVPLFNYKKFLNLLSFGGWITVSNIISPIMAYFDRFILSSIVGANKIAMYTAPAEVVSKMLMLPMAVGKALFPRMVVTNNESKIQQKTLIGVFLLAITMALPLFVFSEFFLFVWLGEGYSDAATTLRILLVGFIFNAVAQVPYTVIQARGHSKLTAKIHLFELIPYLLVLYMLISNFSINGAAVAWSMRVIADFLILETFSRRIAKTKGIVE